MEPAQFGLKSYGDFKIVLAHKFDLKAQVLFQTKIARHGVQLPINYSHFDKGRWIKRQYK